jgi:hypothetical protein
MGFFDKMAQRAEEKTLKHIQTFLLPGETIVGVIEGINDWIAVTDKRILVSDKDLNILDKSTQTVFSFKKEDVKGLIVDSPISGILKFYHLGFSVGRLTPKITFTKQDDCMAAYHKLAAILY